MLRASFLFLLACSLVSCSSLEPVKTTVTKRFFVPSQRVHYEMVLKNGIITKRLRECTITMSSESGQGTTVVALTIQKHQW